MTFYFFRRASSHLPFPSVVSLVVQNFAPVSDVRRHARLDDMLDLITIFSAAGLQQELKSAHGDKSRLGDGGMVGGFAVRANLVSLCLFQII